MHFGSIFEARCLPVRLSPSTREQLQILNRCKLEEANYRTCSSYSSRSPLGEAIGVAIGAAGGRGPRGDRNRDGAATVKAREPQRQWGGGFPRFAVEDDPAGERPPWPRMGHRVPREVAQDGHGVGSPPTEGRARRARIGGLAAWSATPSSGRRGTREGTSEHEPPPPRDITRFWSEGRRHAVDAIAARSQDGAATTRGRGRPSRWVEGATRHANRNGETKQSV
jgi:hypothetical protein